tara:strand:+ start:268 stop:552 length:285 start_codon:yes stop_codon:yes gene_type:complete
MKKLEDYISEVIENISNDRALALTLLTNVMEGINTGHDHKDLGQVASKYLETLQRSNEQLVKVTTLIQKKDATKFSGLSSEDKSDIFDLINEEG